MNANNSPFDLPLHGTCQHCKHFHKNCPIRLPPEGGRVKCARCEQDMFGLGRADTQYTLASVNSLPLPQRGFNAGAGPVRSPDSPPTQSWILSQLRPENIAHELQPFLERQQTMASTSGRVGRAGSPSTEVQSSTAHSHDDIRAPSQPVSSIYLRLVQRLPYHRTMIAAMDFANTFGMKIAAGLPQTRREYSIFGWRFIIYPPENQAGGPTPAEQDSLHHITDLPAGNARAGNLMMTEDPNLVNPDGHSGARSPITLAGSSTPSARPDSSANAFPTVEGQSDRLKQHRRQKTLLSDALQKLNCRCRGDCDCNFRPLEPPTSDSEIGDAHSSRVRTPPHPDEIPPHAIIDRLRGPELFLLFSHLGHSTDSSDQSMDTSQASTLASGGPVQLHPSRPRLTTRSQSMPRL